MARTGDANEHRAANEHSTTDARVSSARLRWASLGGPLLFLIALLYAARVEPYHFVGDDGGITLRYAERLAQGAGFSYNPNEHVNGCSNPLYTLALAGMLRTGIDPGSAVHWLAALGFAGAIGLLFATFARFYSVGAGFVVALLAVAYTIPFEMLFDGLEVPFAWLLVALLFRLLHSERAWVPGIALGLLVANKLDGGLAALAYAFVFVATRRRFPLAAAAAALLAALPVLFVVFLAFDSILPNSMLVKISGALPAAPFEPLWMHQGLWAGCFLTYLAALSTLLVIPCERSGRPSPVLVLQLWLLLHLGAYALVDLGAPHPWYLATPHALVLVLAGFAVHAWPRVLLPTRLRQMRALPVALCLGLAWIKGPQISQRLDPLTARPGLPLYASTDLARQAAGVWLRVHTSGRERFAVAFGLPAYEYEGPVHDLSSLNSRPAAARDVGAAYKLYAVDPDDTPPWTRADRLLVALFQFDRQSRKYALYADPGSEIAAAEVHHLPPELAADVARGRVDPAPVPILAVLHSTSFKLTCRRWRARIDLVESGVLPDGATQR